jgi:hypothetical protein
MIGDSAKLCQEPGSEGKVYTGLLEYTCSSASGLNVVLSVFCLAYIDVAALLLMVRLQQTWLLLSPFAEFSV